MRIELLALCDAANDSLGKLNVLGMFDSIQASQLPLVHPRCAIVLKIRFERLERGQHRLKLDLIDQDGSRIIPALEAPVAMNFPDAASSGTVQLILDLQNVRFERAGEYSINLAIDGRHEASTPLFVRNSVPAGNAS